MKKNKLVSLITIIASSLIVSACGQNPETALNSQENLGLYKGMEVSFIRDKSSSPSKGFYVINDFEYKSNGQSNPDFKEEIVGHYKNYDVFFVRDHTDSVGKGFYLIKDKNGVIIPTLNMSTTYSSGKSTQQYNVGILFESNIKNIVNEEKAPKIQLNNDVFNVSQMSSEELTQLGQTLLRIAQIKNGKE